MQDEKSQLQNKERAMRVLRARLYERELAEQQAKIASERKAQVGSGERSEKIRTYNFPQGRVTDHRIKHTSHNLEGVLAGQLGEFTDALAAEEKRQRLEAAASAGLSRGDDDRRDACARRSSAAVDALAAAGVEDPRLDAELLLGEATGCERAALVADAGAEVPAPAARRVRRDGAAAAAARAGRLHPRPQRASAASSWRSTGGC